MPNRGCGPCERREDWLASPVTCWFRFYAQLNDFLPADRRGRPIAASYAIPPSVKDAIERLGVPHVEVDWILVNGCPEGFAYRLRRGDRVSVCPTFQSLDLGPASGRFPRDSWDRL